MAEGIVEVVKVARNLGDRVIAVVRALDPTVDPVSVCFRPSRLIAQDLHEKICVVRHEEDQAALIRNAIMPIGPSSAVRTPIVTLDEPAGVAWVEVPPDSITFLSTAGQVARVALVSRLVGWEVRFTAGGRGGRGA